MDMDHLANENMRNARAHRAMAGEAYPLEKFINEMVNSYKRSCYLQDPTCLYVAIKQIRQDMKSKGLPITHRQARAILTSK